MTATVVIFNFAELFASFGNNYVDNASSKMYRNSFSFAGLGYDSGKNIIAKSFFKSTVELVLPAIRYRKFGFFNLFATYSHPTIFAGGLFTKNYDENTQKTCFEIIKSIDK